MRSALNLIQGQDRGTKGPENWECGRVEQSNICFWMRLSVRGVASALLNELRCCFSVSSGIQH